MAPMFIWGPARLAPAAAAERFAAVLATQRARYLAAFGREPGHTALAVGETWVAQLQLASGVTGWTPWAQAPGHGLAWSGICEQYLGVTPDAPAVERIVNTVVREPRQLLAWDGRFAICTWDRERGQVVLTTGPTESPSFWYAEGPDGWAIGTTALPLLELVGRRPKIDHDMARLFAQHGYLAGPASLLEGVTRIPSRRQAISTDGGKPRMSAYLTLEAYLAPDGPAPGWAETVAISAERLTARIARQLAHCDQPELLLTGGRDSRCIAAAAVRAGFAGPAFTSGPAGSDDVRIAARVAAALGLEHRRAADEGRTGSVQALVAAPERVRLWTRLSEGMETIRHAAGFEEFFAGELPFPATVRAKLHGLGGEISRGYYYPDRANLSAVVDAPGACEVIAAHASPRVRGTPRSAELLRELFDQIGREMGARPLTLAAWLDLYYWQGRCLHWGEDMMTVKEPTGWRWTPLFDRALIRAAWGLAPEDKASSKLIEAITLRLQPSLAEIGYNKAAHGHHSPLQTAKAAVKSLARRTPLLAALLPRKRSKKYAVDEHLRQFWDDTLLHGGERYWPALVEQSDLREVLRDPSDELLWNLATVELMAGLTAEEFPHSPAGGGGTLARSA